MFYVGNTANSWFHRLQGHDRGFLTVGNWVAVAYNEGFFIGKTTAVVSKSDVSVDFLVRSRDGHSSGQRRRTRIMFMQNFALTHKCKWLAHISFCIM